MRSEWTSYKIGEIFELVNGYAFKSGDFISSGIPVLKIKNVKPNNVVLDDLSYVSVEVASRRNDKAIRRGDILITMSGNRFDGSKDTWVGKVAYFDNSGHYMLNQRVGVLRPREGVVIDRKCAAYFLSSDDYQKLFISIATSSGGQANLSPAQILGEQLHLPPIEEQARISELLGGLDDRITLLRETNATLEAIAQALFKSWFVDFDPVRAKAEGRQPEGMDATTAALFPDSFEESELGLLPRGWQWSGLDNIADVTMGLSPKGDSYNSDGVGTPLINGPVEFGDYFPVQTKWTNMASRVSAFGDLIFCVRGSTTGRRVVADGEYCIGRGVCAIRSRYEAPGFIYQTINFGLDRLLAKTTGSVFPSLSGPDIKNFRVLNPSPELMGAYERITKSLLGRIQSNQAQAQTLTQLRDTLLPRLISGQLRLPDAEQLTEEAC